jgi:hypothetical protein
MGCAQSTAECRSSAQRTYERSKVKVFGDKNKLDTKLVEGLPSLLKEQACKAVWGDDDLQKVTLVRNKNHKKLEASWPKGNFQEEVKAKITFLDNEVVGPLLEDDRMLRTVFTQLAYSMRHAVARNTFNDRVVPRLLGSMLLPNWLEGFRHGNQAPGVDFPKENAPELFLQLLSDFLSVRNQILAHLVHNNDNQLDFGWMDNAAGPLYLDAAGMDMILGEAEAVIAGDKGEDKRCHPQVTTDKLDLRFAAEPFAADNHDDKESSAPSDPDVDQTLFGLRQKMFQITFDIINSIRDDAMMLSLFDSADIGLDELSLTRTQNLVSAAVMSALMEVDCPFPVFLGSESAGKSTLINKLMNPDGPGDDVLPTGPEMCSQHIAVVRRSIRMGVEFKGNEHPGVGSIKDALSNSALEVAQKRGTDALRMSIATSIACVRCPFQGPGGHCYVDVPGLKPETAHETKLVLAVTGVLVLVVADLDRMQVALAEGGQLEQLPELYEQIAFNYRPVPIVVMVTQVSSTVFQAERSKPNVTSLVHSTGYAGVIADHFKSCTAEDVTVLHANCWDPAVNPAQLALQLDDLVNGAPHPLTWKQRYTQAVRQCQIFWTSVEKVVRRIPCTRAGVSANGGSSTVEQSFNTQYRDALDKCDEGVTQLMTAMLANSAPQGPSNPTPQRSNLLQDPPQSGGADSKHGQKLKEWLTEIDARKHLRNQHCGKVAHLPVIRYVLAHAIEMEDEIQKVHIMNQLLSEYRVSVAMTVWHLGERIFDKQYAAFLPMVNPLILKSNSSRKVSLDVTTNRVVHLVPAEMEKRLKTWFHQDVPGLVHEVSQCERFVIPDSPAPKDHNEAYFLRLKWEHVASYANQLCSNRDIFPALLTGYYLTTSDEYFQHAFMEGVGKFSKGPANQKQAFASVTTFPDCMQQDDWNQHIAVEEKKVRELRELVRQRIDPSELRNKQILAVRETAARICKNLDNSNLFSTAGCPLVRRVAQLAFRNLKQALVRYEYAEHDITNRPEPKFTAAGDALTASNLIAEDVQNIFNLLNVRAYDLAERALVEFVDARRQCDTGSKLFDKLDNAVNNFQQGWKAMSSGLSVTEGIFVIHAADDAVASTTLTCCNIQAGFKATNGKAANLNHSSCPIKSMEKQHPTIVKELLQQRPSNVVFLRKVDAALASTPMQGEKKLLEAMSSMSFIGRLWVVSSGSLARQKWQQLAKYTVIEFIENVNMDRNAQNVRQVDPTQMTDIGARISKEFHSITTIARARVESARAAFHGGAGQEGCLTVLGSILNEYAVKRERRAPLNINNWFEFDGERLLEELISKIPEMPLKKLQLPHHQIFDYDPFTQRASCKFEFHEMMVRQFYERAIVPQIMHNGVLLGKHVYEWIVTELLRAIAEQFGSNPNRCLDTILFSLRKARSLAQSSRDQQRTTRNHENDKDLIAHEKTVFAAEMLQRDNIVHLYAGGLVFAAAPMLTGMLQGKLELKSDKFSMKLVNELSQQTFAHLEELQRGVAVVFRA